MCFVIIKNCFIVAASYPFFVGIRGNVTYFSEFDGNTTHLQNELKETLIMNTQIRFGDSKYMFFPSRVLIHVDHVIRCT